MQQCSECCTECSKKGCTNNIKNNVYFNANKRERERKYVCVYICVFSYNIGVESANNCVNSEMCVSYDEARMEFALSQYFIIVNRGYILLNCVECEYS